MPGSLTTPGPLRSRVDERLSIAFRAIHSVGTRKGLYGAQWPAYACPCRRFACALAGADARLGVDMTR